MFLVIHWVIFKGIEMDRETKDCLLNVATVLALYGKNTLFHGVEGRAIFDEVKIELTELADRLQNAKVDEK